MRLFVFYDIEFTQRCSFTEGRAGGMWAVLLEINLAGEKLY